MIPKNYICKNLTSFDKMCCVTMCLIVTCHSLSEYPSTQTFLFYKISTAIHFHGSAKLDGGKWCMASRLELEAGGGGKWSVYFGAPPNPY